MQDRHDVPQQPAAGCYPAEGEPLAAAGGLAGEQPHIAWGQGPGDTQSPLGDFSPPHGLTVLSSLSICRYEHFISLCRSQGCSSNQGGGGGGEGGNSPLFKSFQLWTVNQLYTYTPSINYRGIPIWNGETNWISPLDVAQVSHALQSNLMFLWGGVHVRGISGWSQPCGYENIACPCVSITKQKGGRQEGCGNGFMV